MRDFPMHFKASAETANGIKTDWTSRAAQADQENQTGVIRCSIPSEFEGPGTGSSPEDFFILAMLNCYVATFKVVAEKSKMAFEQLRGSGTLVIEQDQFKQPVIVRAVLAFEASGVENEERFRRLMERVSKQCMVINSLKIPVEFEFAVVGGSTAGASLN